MHLLISLDLAYKIRDASHVDSIVSAQIPNPIAHPVLYNVISQTMVHGPCGNSKPDAKCMVDGHCSKRYQKEFCENSFSPLRETHPSPHCLNWLLTVGSP